MNWKKIKVVLHWLWSFSPAMWIAFLALIIPILIATVGDCGPCGFVLGIIVEGIMALLCYGLYTFWVSTLRDHVKNWWDNRPKLK